MSLFLAVPNLSIVSIGGCLDFRGNTKTYRVAASMMRRYATWPLYDFCLVYGLLCLVFVLEGPRMNPRSM